MWAATYSSQARTTGLAFDQTPTSKKLDPQDAGHRALLAVVDTATASRYGLPTAALRNAAGKYVPPTAESMLAGENAMKPSAVAGVLASDPGAADQVYADHVAQPVRVGGRPAGRDIRGAWTRSPSVTIWPAVMRGDSDPNGS